MGWSHGWDSKKSLIDYLTRDQESDVHRWEIARKRILGNKLWMVVHRFDKKSDEIKTFIVLNLLTSHAGEWGYKGMDEGMSPFYYNCPLAYLDIGDPPLPGSSAEAWRQQVRAYHARTEGLSVGCVVELEKGCSPRFFRITSMKPLIGNNGLRFKIPRNRIQRTMSYEDYLKENEGAPDGALIA